MPAAHILSDWRNNPLRFVKDNFGVEPDAWQARVLEALPDPKRQRISMQACAGPGKSAVLAWSGWYFLSCFGDRYDHPKGAAMSITSDNLKDNLWAEFSKWQGRSPFLMNTFRWTKERVFSIQHPEDWFISARSFPKTADAEEQGRTLSGLHSRYLIYLIDESGDIQPGVLKAAEQGLSTQDLVFGKIMQAGNPTSDSGMLYAAATVLAHLWWIVRITGDPDDPQRSSRISISWAREQIETHGREDAWVMAYILGMFPKTSINKLLSPDEVQSAMDRVIREEEYAFIRKRLGVDVARFGDDNSVIFPRQGLAAFDCVPLRHSRGPDIAARIAIGMERWKGDPQVFVDGTGGYGAGVVDALLQAQIIAHEINFSSEAIDPRYFNKRAEMWFEMAKWIKRGGCLPHDPILKRELTAPTYTFQKGKFKLEDKDQIKARLKMSPDRADGLALTFASPDVPAPHPILGDRQQSKTSSDWDPNSPEHAGL